MENINQNEIVRNVDNFLFGLNISINKKDLYNEKMTFINIEKSCQIIANQNNTLLDTFPNNVYNKILKLNKINFEYGFLSDSTVSVFTSKKENIR
jgi:hypothetical protein